MNDLLSSMTIALVVLFVLFLILREFMCWYFKINKRISLMEEQNKLLKKLVSGNISLEKGDIEVENNADQPIKNIHNDYTPEAISKVQNDHFTKKGDKKRKFSLYWIYGIFVLAFLGIYFINAKSHTQKTNWTNLKQMLQDKDVQKIILLNNSVAEIYIRPDKLKDPKFKNLHQTAAFRKSEAQYSFEVASSDIFIQEVQIAQKEDPNPVYVESEVQHNWGSDILSWVLAIGLLFVLAFLITINLRAFQKNKSKPS